MRRMWAVAACALAAASVTLAAGFSRRYALGADGVAEIVNSQANSAWRPTVVVMQFSGSATRTVVISRVVDGMAYVVARLEGAASTYVYEFEGAYWFGVGQALRLTVTPAEEGNVEVIGE